MRQRIRSSAKLYDILRELHSKVAQKTSPTAGGWQIHANPQGTDGGFDTVAAAASGVGERVSGDPLTFAKVVLNIRISQLQFAAS